MKKNLVYAMMSAIALTSAVSFTGCASDDGASVDTNPTYDGNNVRTDFAFSISSGKMGGTRMTAVNTLQADNSFLGIKDMYLFPFSLGKTGDVLKVPANNTSTNISNGEGKNFPLGSLTGISAAQSSKVYSLQLPVGTDNFLFYGTVDNSSVTELTKRGALTSTLANTIGNTDDISFSLVPISANLGDDKAKLEAYLSTIAKAHIGDTGSETWWYNTPTTAQTDGAYTTLATLYTNFTTINDAHAGSAEAILRTVLDLYRTAKGVIMQGNAETSPVYQIANAICTAITTGDGTTGCYKVAITETAPVTPATIAPETWTAVWSGLPNTDFPRNLKLPMGAAQLEYNTTSHTFSYKTNPNYVVQNAAGVALGSITYPAELIYFDNSPLRATDSYKTVSDYPTTVAGWDNASGTSDKKFSDDWKSESRVEPSTRAVAMQNNVNYGVALLQTQIQMATGIASNMEDNMKALYPSATDNQKDIDGTKFEVTGILIGGQPKSVGWDMTNPGLKELTGENSNGREEFDQVIYDQDIPTPFNATGNNETIPVGSFSAPIYTLVLDNYTTTNSETQKPVRFALELVNKSGKDFYGKEGLIPNGHTFYLCGELNPGAASGVTNYTKATRPDSYRITKEGIQRVFMQDYKTVANVTISQDALQKAYSSIPDLRATEVLFGLSVDLKWEAGMTFAVEL